VLRVSPVVSIEPISHVHEFLRDDHLERPRPRLIDPRQVDQDEMISGCRCKRIRAADGALQPATQPALENPTLGGDAKPVRWQFQEHDVSFQESAGFLVADCPTHDGLQGNE